MIKQFRKKPVTIEAIQYTGDNLGEILEFLEANKCLYDAPATQEGMRILSILTMEGEMNCVPGYWIIKGVKGEIYPCRSDIFEQTYEEVIE